MKIIISLFFIGIFGFLAVMAFQSYQQQSYAHDHYKPVDAIVTVSKVVFSSRKGNASALIEYSYTVDGQNYKSQRYSYLSPDERAEDLVKKYPLNAHVTAYVDPDKPGESILYIVVTPITTIVGWFVTPLLLMLGVWFFYRWLKRWAAAKRQA